MAEIELKFELSAEACTALARSPALAGTRATRARTLALYFDTPARELGKHRMALRLRGSAGHWQQCLKAGGSGTGGLHSRDEWEMPAHGTTLDLSRFASTPLARLPRARTLHRRLAEAFRVEVERTTWKLQAAPGARVEIALDVGTLSSGANTEAISEVEIESLSGEPLAVFDMAERLLETVPMRPSIASKAARGFRLADGEAARPLKARAPKLSPDMTPEEAARAVIATALAQMQHNEDGALATDDPEFVHQMRVALRRLRGALRVFRGVVGKKRARALNTALRSVARIMGTARDWDVFDTETLPGLGEHFGEEREGREVGPQVRAHREDAREAMRAALRSPAHSRAVLALSRWLAGPHAQSSGEPLAAFAARAVARRHAKLAHRARKLDPFDTPRRHKLRIEAKRLRYTVDTFAGLFPAAHARAYLDALSDLQDDLGAANDAHVASTLLDSLVLDPGPVQEAREHLAAAERTQAARLPGHLETILGARRFWED